MAGPRCLLFLAWLPGVRSRGILIVKDLTPVLKDNCMKKTKFSFEFYYFHDFLHVSSYVIHVQN